MRSFDFAPGTTAYNLKNALRLAEASELAYKTEGEIKRCVENKWGFDKFRYFSEKETQAFVAAKDDVIILSFKGTTSIEDWLTNIRVSFVEGPWGKNVHMGFCEALEYVWDEIYAAIKEFQNNKLHPLWITGHSLGGALGTLATARFLESGRTVKCLYTFGQPRVGDKLFAEKYDYIFRRRTFRFVNYHDIVPRVPPRAGLYKHIGRIAYIDSSDKIRLDIGAWRKFLDLCSSDKMKAAKRYDELKEAMPDGIRDHEIKRYISKIRKNM